MQTSSQLGPLQQAKTINSKFFIYGSECEEKKLRFGVCVGGGGGGGDFSDQTAYFAFQLSSHPYLRFCK